MRCKFTKKKRSGLTIQANCLSAQAIPTTHPLPSRREGVLGDEVNLETHPFPPKGMVT